MNPWARIGCWLPLVTMVLLALRPVVAADELVLELRHQVETSEGSGRFHTLVRDETWRPQETAIIVCDMWDLHHCLNAVRRVQQIAPRINAVLGKARPQGVTIIHAPSDCMDTYENHPARRRAVETPMSTSLPEDIRSWCSVIPEEQRGTYPVDQSDGGEDDDLVEHAEWAAQLESMGRNPKAPWKSQCAAIEIDGDQDFVTDRGDEIWSILERRGIKNVILTGVHTNMCVLGRPFGLRQMARNGKHVVLVRDLTDTMYNPRSWPYVSHFTGTDLIVSHIERYVCPTITSDQLIGGRPLRFAHDHRPHVVMVIAEDEYRTAEMLPEFAAQHLGKGFRVSFVFGSEQDRNQLPGLEVLNDADVMLVSVRRRALPVSDLDLIRRFVAAGKPVVGIRTASHAFALRDANDVPAGHAVWPEFDREVFGGNYHGHLGNQLKSTVALVAAPPEHAVLDGLSGAPFAQGWSLYETAPLAPGTTTLLVGNAEGHPDEPVAWTYTRRDGGRSFYTSLGHAEDFQQPDFVRLLSNALYWAAGK